MHRMVVCDYDSASPVCPTKVVTKCQYGATHLVDASSDIVISGIVDAIGLGLGGGLDSLDHLEDIADLGGVQRGAGEHASILFAVLEGDAAREALRRERNQSMADG